MPCLANAIWGCISRNMRCKTEVIVLLYSTLVRPYSLDFQVPPFQKDTETFERVRYRARCVAKGLEDKLCEERRRNEACLEKRWILGEAWCQFSNIWEAAVQRESSSAPLLQRVGQEAMALKWSTVDLDEISGKASLLGYRSPRWAVEAPSPEVVKRSWD